MQRKEEMICNKSFIVLSAKGTPLIKIPFMSPSENKAYEDRLSLYRSELLMRKQK